MNYQSRKQKLDKILCLLTNKERDLFKDMAEAGSYKNLRLMPQYNQYTEADLRQKVCRLRKYIIYLIEELKNNH